MEHTNKGAPSRQGGGEISLSVEDTNKLRKKLGLRPLRLTSSQDEREKEREAKAKAEKQIQDKALQAKARIETMRKTRMENSILASRAISTSVLDAGDDDEGDVSDDDPAAWVAKMRNRRVVPAEQKKRKRPSKKSAGGGNPESDVIGQKAINELDLDHADAIMEDHENVILTLKDANVLSDAEEEGSNPKDALQSIDVAERFKKREKQMADPTAKYDPTDNDQFDENKASGSYIAGDTRNVRGHGGDSGVGGNTNVEKEVDDSSIAEKLSLSIAADGEQKFQEDYESNGIAEPTFSRHKKSKKRKSKKRKRSIEAELRDALDSNETSTVSGKKPPRQVSRASGIRSKAVRRLEAEDDEDGDDDAEAILQTSLRRARENAKDSTTDASMQRILKIIDQAEENAGETDDMDTAANMIFNEMEQYVRNIPSVEQAKEESSDEDEMNITMAHAKKVQTTKASTSKQEKPEETPPSPPPELESKVVHTGNPIVDTRENPTAEMGVAAALARFRAMGDLRSRPEQVGRARDERIDWKELDSTVKVPAGQRKIKLNYTDESGHELTPKEAFRLMCHKFHGKGPSKNKRELRLRRQLQNMRLQQMANDDTPLGSSSALRNETRRTGVAHVVLSGPSVAPVAPAIEQNALGKTDDLKD